MTPVIKKIGSLFMAGAMLAALTSCSSSKVTSSSGDSSTTTTTQTQAQKITLTYWNINTADPQKTMTENIIKKWNADNPNIQIEASSTENDAYKTKIKTAISANQAPDIIYAWTLGFTQPFV